MWMFIIWVRCRNIKYVQLAATFLLVLTYIRIFEIQIHVMIRMLWLFSCYSMYVCVSKYFVLLNCKRKWCVKIEENIFWKIGLNVWLLVQEFCRCSNVEWEITILTSVCEGINNHNAVIYALVLISSHFKFKKNRYIRAPSRF